MIQLFISLALICQLTSAQILSLQNNQPPLLANLGNNGFNNLAVNNLGSGCIGRGLSNGNGFGNGVGLGNEFGLGNGIGLGSGIGVGNGIGLGNGIGVGNGISNTLTFPMSTNGPSFPSGQGIPPYGIQITADALEIGGSLGVTGQLPIYGTVAVDGNLPSDGSATVNYSCGQLTR